MTKQKNSEGIKLKSFLKKRKRNVALMLPTSRDSSFDAYQKHANVPESKPARLNSRRVTKRYQAFTRLISYGLVTGWKPGLGIKSYASFHSQWKLEWKSCWYLCWALSAYSEMIWKEEVSGEVAKPAGDTDFSRLARPKAEVCRRIWEK